MPRNLIDPTILEQLLASDAAAMTGIVARAAGVASVAGWSLDGCEPIGGCAGYAAPKALAWVRWWAADGRSGRNCLVVKHFPGWHGHGEAAIYARLEAVGAPVPRCLGRLDDARGDEVLFLERLPLIGFDPSDQEDRLALARSFAALHRLDPRPWLEAGYPRLAYAPGAETRRGRALDALAELAQGVAGQDLATKAVEVDRRLREQPDLVRRCSVWADRLPQALVHADNPPQNAGRRQAGGELLWFDWHKASVGCAAADLLAAFPDAAFTWDEDDEAVARTYAATLGHDHDPPLRETLPRVLLLQRLGTLPWHGERCRDGRVDWTDDREEGRATYRTWTGALLAELDRLLAQPMLMGALP